MKAAKPATASVAHHLAAIRYCTTPAGLKAVAAAIRHSVPAGHAERPALREAWRAKEAELKEKVRG